MIAKHPANHRIVQEILLRSAACQSSSPVGARALLKGAKSIASLPYALRNLSRKGWVTPISSSTGKSVSPRRGRTKVEGAGAAISRIVNDVAWDLDDAATENGSKRAKTDASSKDAYHVSPSEFEALTQRYFSFDDAWTYTQRVQEILQGSLGREFMVVAVGPHRRGSPFSSSVQLLCTHADSTIQNNADRIYFAKAVKALHVGLRLGDGRGAVSPIASRHSEHHESVSLRVPFDPSSAASTSTAMGRLHLHWTPFDLFAVRTLLLTGPLGYNAEFIASSSARGFDVSYAHGLRRFKAAESTAGGEGPAEAPLEQHMINTATEAELFSAVGIPYVHPVNRLE